MNGGSGNDGSPETNSGSSSRVSKWVLLDGNRFVVAGAIAGSIAVLVYALALLGVITLGPDSNVRTLLSSGLTSGLLTLVTVALSINQLLLSRVFGPPAEFADRLSGTNEFRNRVAKAADTSLYENEPKEFLRHVMEAVQKRTDALKAELSPEAPAELTDYAEEIDGYAAKVAETIGEDTRTGESSTMDVLSTLLGPEYAHALTTIPRLQDEHADHLSEEAQAQLEAILELMKSVAIFRQFLKTLAIQQDLARLSRLVAYTGVLALAVVFVATTFYASSSSATLSEAVLQPVVSLSLGVATLPLALLVSYVLRVATISRYTVSVGSFVAPEERFQG